MRFRRWFIANYTLTNPPVGGRKKRYEMKPITPEMREAILAAAEHSDSTQLRPDTVYEIAADTFICETGGLIVNNDIFCFGPRAQGILKTHPLEEGREAFYADSL
jgi:hypothetical protein